MVVVVVVVVMVVMGEREVSSPALTSERPFL